jgi:hypothetical protein
MATSDAPRRGRRRDVWISASVTLLLLVLTDLALSAWQRWPVRLPEHFSSSYLQRYATQSGLGSSLVVLGDSELWGFGVAPRDSPVALLAHGLTTSRVTNLAYEAETPINADFMLRYLLSRGVRPRAVVVELNPAAFNETAVAYDTLNAALAELSVPTLVEPFDRGKLNPALLRAVPAADQLDRFVSDHWLLYGARVDLHQALFGDADLASALHRRIEPLLQPAARPRATAYAATYDLTPLDADNVSYAYAGHLFRTLAAQRIPALVVLPPVNHALLHPYIDNAAYDDNLRRIARLATANHLTVVNDDRLLEARYFLDNTHVNRAGAQRFAQALAPHVARLLDVL